MKLGKLLKANADKKLALEVPVSDVQPAEVRQRVSRALRQLYILELEERLITKRQ
jgi:hypothetical protein